MNKKKKVILSIFVGIVATWGYFYWKFRDINYNLTSLSSVSNNQDAVILDYPEKIYHDEELQKNLFAELKGLEKLPKFENFLVEEFSNNENIIVDIDSHPIGQEFRTAIRHSVKTVGINFAGKYSIAEWGCGTTCSNGAMVDADTGHVYPLPEPMANGFDSRKDSRLLIQNPIVMGGDWPRPWYKMSYWEWTGDSFKSLGVYKVDLEQKEIIAMND